MWGDRSPSGLAKKLKQKSETTLQKETNKEEGKPFSFSPSWLLLKWFER